MQIYYRGNREQTELSSFTDMHLPLSRNYCYDGGLFPSPCLELPVGFHLSHVSVCLSLFGGAAGLLLICTAPHHFIKTSQYTSGPAFQTPPDHFDYTVVTMQGLLCTLCSARQIFVNPIVCHSCHVQLWPVPTREEPVQPQPCTVLCHTTSPAPLCAAIPQVTFSLTAL